MNVRATSLYGGKKCNSQHLTHLVPDNQTRPVTVLRVSYLFIYVYTINSLLTIVAHTYVMGLKHVTYICVFELKGLKGLSGNGSFRFRI